MLRLDATPQKRCLGFDFRFKKFRIKQAIFINDIFPFRVEAHCESNFGSEHMGPAKGFFYPTTFLKSILLLFWHIDFFHGKMVYKTI